MTQADKAVLKQSSARWQQQLIIMSLCVSSIQQRLISPNTSEPVRNDLLLMSPGSVMPIRNDLPLTSPYLVVPVRNQSINQ